jgi:hypothetical protein
MLERFDSVEAILFWFCRCKNFRYDLMQKNSSSILGKICSIDDVEIILNRLLLARIILPEHIKVLKKYTEQSIIPTPGIDDDADVFLWKDLIDALFPVFSKKGFLQDCDNEKNCCVLEKNSNMNEIKNTVDDIATNRTQ